MQSPRTCAAGAGPGRPGPGRRGFVRRGQDQVEDQGRRGATENDQGQGDLESEHACLQRDLVSADGRSLPPGGASRPPTSNRDAPERRLHCVMRKLPRVFARLGGIGETGLGRFRRPAVRRAQSGPAAGAPDVARAGERTSPRPATPALARTPLAAAGRRCRRAALSRCGGHGEAMAFPVVSQKLPDQMLPVPVGAK